MNELKIGDTIQCHDEKGLLSVHAELMRCGVYSDWLDIKEDAPKKWTLTVTGFEKGKENAISRKARISPAFNDLSE